MFFFPSLLVEPRGKEITEEPPRKRRSRWGDADASTSAAIIPPTPPMPVPSPMIPPPVLSETAGLGYGSAHVEELKTSK